MLPFLLLIMALGAVYGFYRYAAQKRQNRLVIARRVERYMAKRLQTRVIAKVNGTTLTLLVAAPLDSPGEARLEDDEDPFSPPASCALTFKEVVVTDGENSRTYN